MTFAGAECGLQSRSGLAAESFDSTSLATRRDATTTRALFAGATRDDGGDARARDDARRVASSTSRARRFRFSTTRDKSLKTHRIARSSRRERYTLRYARAASSVARPSHARAARRVARSTRAVHVVHVGATYFIISGSACLAMWRLYTPVYSDAA